MRLLFVDDEPRILEGLQRMLRKQRREWEMVFALGSREALAECETGAFDLIISDMRMPEVDGAALLEEVQRRFPSTVRFLLSGQTDPEAALRAARVAHRFLTKPTDAVVIREAVVQVGRLQAELTHPSLRDDIGSVGNLPSPPALLEQLKATLAKAEVSFADVVEIVASDPAIAAKVLQLVNSSFFGTGRRIESLRLAAELLGTHTLKKLALSSEVFRASATAPELHRTVERLRVHSVRVARVARRLLPAEEEEAYLAGLLHDIGRLLLLDGRPESLSAPPESGGEREVAEHSEAQAGAYLLGLWNLSDRIVDAVAHHHQPEQAKVAPELTMRIHVADALVNEAEAAAAGAPGVAVPLDDPLLKRMDMSHHLPEWRAIALEEVARP